jgi:hypothetical protein
MILLHTYHLYTHLKPNAESNELYLYFIPQVSYTIAVS